MLNNEIESNSIKIISNVLSDESINQILNNATFSEEAIRKGCEELRAAKEARKRARRVFLFIQVINYFKH